MRRPGMVDVTPSLHGAPLQAPAAENPCAAAGGRSCSPGARRTPARTGWPGASRLSCRRTPPCRWPAGWRRPRRWRPSTGLPGSLPARLARLGATSPNLNRDLRYPPRETRLALSPNGLDHRRAEVDPHVGSLVRGEDRRLRVLDPAFGDLHIVHVQRALAALARTTAVIVELEPDGGLARRQGDGRGDRTALEAQEVVVIRR